MKYRVTSQAVVDLFEKQLAEWPEEIKQRYEELKDFKSVKQCQGADEDVIVPSKQLLSFRKGSTAADLKAVAEGKRPCFLCESGRLPGQLSLDLGEYELLVNPYPAVYPHFTIPTKEHTPQSIKGRILDMVALARLIPNSVVTYNGPRCGASAPDHMHFQAVNEYASVLAWMRNTDCYRVCGTERCGVYEPAEVDSLFPYLFIDSINDRDLEAAFEKLVGELPHAEGEEPMMNVAVYASGENGTQVRVIVMPRAAHRPDFFGTGEGEMLVSPGVIEMLGLFTLSRPEDFERLDYEKAMEVYRQVALSDEDFDQWIERLEGWRPNRK